MLLLTDEIRHQLPALYATEAVPLEDSQAGPVVDLLPSVIPVSTGLFAAGLPPLP